MHRHKKNSQSKNVKWLLSHSKTFLRLTGCMEFEGLIKEERNKRSIRSSVFGAWPIVGIQNQDISASAESVLIILFKTFSSKSLNFMEVLSYLRVPLYHGLPFWVSSWNVLTAACCFYTTAGMPWKENTVRKIELGICINVQHLTIAHSFTHLLQPIKHLAQILSAKKKKKIRRRD